jgi:SAM-dependent methyltransferase
VKPPDARYWDSVGAAFDTENRLWRAHSDAINAALVSRWASASAHRVLKTDLFDEFLGPGLYSVLRERAQTLVAIDLSTTIARGARERHEGPIGGRERHEGPIGGACEGRESPIGGARHGREALIAVTADVLRLPFASQSFDLVVSTSTLDHFAHFEQVEQSLAEIKRVLRKGGQLILTLDNLVNPVIALRAALPPSILQRLGLTAYFVGATCGPRRLRQSLERAGFEVRDMDAILHAPRVLAIPASRWILRHGSPRLQERCARALMTFESMARWPTRFVSAYFIAVSAFGK